MHPLPVGLRLILVVVGFLAVLLGTCIDIIDFGVIPLWFYVGAHVVIVVGFYERGAPHRVFLSLPVFILTIPLTCLAMTSMGHDLYRIKPGMTVEEVRRVMAGYEGESELEDARRSGEYAAFFRYADAPQGDATVGMVYFTDGKVTGVHLSPD